MNNNDISANNLSETGIRIRRRRNSLRLSQKEVAAKCLVSANHISAIECGREKLSLDLLLRLCDVLRTTPDYLLLGNVHVNADYANNLSDKLQLCTPQDIRLVNDFIELLIARNGENWSNEHYLL